MPIIIIERTMTIRLGGFNCHSLLYSLTTVIQLLSLLRFTVPVVASPQLVARGDSQSNSDWGTILKNGVDSLKTDDTKAPDLFCPLRHAIPLVEPDTDNDAASSATVDIELMVTETPLPSKNRECDPDDSAAHPQECDVPVDQLVFSSSCKDLDPIQVATDEQRSQNQVITDKLIAIAGQEGVRISKSRTCDVYLWAVPLTSEDITDLLDNTVGIDAIEPNQRVRMAGYSSANDQEQTEPVAVPAEGTNRHKKRTVINDIHAPDHLKFISTPDGPLRDAYFYDQEAGYDVNIIHFDTGANEAHDEFQLNQYDPLRNRRDPIVAWHFYGINTVDEPTDYGKFGTCRVSALAGPKYGVSKRANVFLAKVALDLGSIVSAMVDVFDFLIEANNHRDVRGSFVMTIPLLWEDTRTTGRQRLAGLFSVMTRPRLYEVIIVVPAGEDDTNSNSDIIDMPTVFSSEYPLITVGAVEVDTGRTYPWSRRGNRFSVAAPGIITCAANAEGGEFITKRGTDVATTLTGALIAYFLSLRNIWYQLRNNPQGFSFAMRDFMVEEGSYVSSTDGAVDRRIWNLLDMQRD